MFQILLLIVRHKWPSWDKSAFVSVKPMIDGHEAGISITILSLFCTFTSSCVLTSNSTNNLRLSYAKQNKLKWNSMRINSTEQNNNTNKWQRAEKLCILK